MPSHFTDEALTQPVRDAIHAFALNGRELLTREAHDLLEGVYGLHADGTLEAPENLPALKDPETRGTYDRLKRFLKDEIQAGLAAEEAVNKLVKEIAFTHLNRLVAFKMLESNKLIREAVGRGPESNGFKFYLADHPEEEAHWRAGENERAYNSFLRWQTSEIAREVPVLFDPDDLPSHLFPRLAVLNEVLAELNAPELAPAWGAEETIGWVYQFFNELENAAVFDRLFKQKKKIRREDIPAATQRFTPRWIVRYLVENTLGRLWVQMHPDSALGSELRYLVPAAGELPVEKLRPVREISLLDPASGTMHFGLVAFDLFAEMYREELKHAGTPGWPAQPSVAKEAEIPAAILEHNLFGIDIDLRATQLAALSLYVKAKRMDRSAQLRVHNLACADVLPFSTADLARFLVEMKFTNPIFEKMLRRIREQLADIQQVGSLLRIERELRSLVEEQRRKDTQKRQAKHGDTSQQLGLLNADEQAAMEAEYYDLLEAQLVQALDFFRQQAAGQGEDLRFFTGEATKSLRVLDLLLRRYDVVLANPPYMSRGSMSDDMAAFLDHHYPEGKSDLYAAFISRCTELTEEAGRVGMITQQSFMFISSYEELRTGLLETFSIETMAHTGPHAFPEIQGEKVNTTIFVLRRDADAARRTQNIGTYFRLVHASDADNKRVAFEYALEGIHSATLPTNIYFISQSEFSVIPSNPWIYDMPNSVRLLFKELPKLSDIAYPRAGMHGGDRFRFARYWWEVGIVAVAEDCKSLEYASKTNKKWFPYMKGGSFRKWYGNQEWVIAFDRPHYKILSECGNKLPNRDFYFKPGITCSKVTTGGAAMRFLPEGFIFADAATSIFPKSKNILSLLAILNSEVIAKFLSYISPTINFESGHLALLPIPQNTEDQTLETLAGRAVRNSSYFSSINEGTYDFIAPLQWDKGLGQVSSIYNQLNTIESAINDEVYSLYNISPTVRSVIKAALTGNALNEENGDGTEEEEAQEEKTQTVSKEELAVRWISYAVGIVLGRFMPGAIENREKKAVNSRRAPGSAVYYREDFAIGSLPAPDEAEFNELVGLPDQFAYVDADGGRHVFSVQVEQALQKLSLDDGIAVLDSGHPRDLAALVVKALVLMLGEAGTGEVVVALGGEASQVQDFLRRFLSKDYFTAWHLSNRWYRKRPVYWPIQSAKRSYGFILFHEKITRDTLYTIQREPYLDTKRNAVALRIGDLQGTLAGTGGSTRKKLEKELDDLQKLSAELQEFAKEIESITMGGYNPTSDWIDDGVILRMAPLWKVIPIWKTEPKKYWDRLEAGDFDWSHIAMNYWSSRVKAKCKTNKSCAIAHGHEEWYEGK